MVLSLVIVPDISLIERAGDWACAIPVAMVRARTDRYVLKGIIVIGLLLTVVAATRV
jgi:hypothetical protein